MRKGSDVLRLSPKERVRLAAIRTEKWCPACQQMLPVQGFYKMISPSGIKIAFGYCRKCHLAKVTKYRHDNGTRISFRANCMLAASRFRAKERKIEHTLTSDWVTERLEKGHCEATGVPFDLTPTSDDLHRNPRTPSIDRINSNKGYTSDNSRMVTIHFNVAKEQYTDEETLTMFEQALRLSKPHLFLNPQENLL